MTETENIPEAETPESGPIERNFGPQPLDALLLAAGLDNHDIVQASKDPMTHKAVQRARKGRRLTPHMKRRMAEALNRALSLRGTPAEPEHRVKDLFNY